MVRARANRRTYTAQHADDDDDDDDEQHATRPIHPPPQRQTDMNNDVDARSRQMNGFRVTQHTPHENCAQHSSDTRDVYLYCRGNSD